MIISASVVRRPRVVRVCEGQHAPHRMTTGPIVRLYGHACRGDVPYVIWICPKMARQDEVCLSKLSTDDAVAVAAA